jgi:hypothetical protein
VFKRALPVALLAAALAAPAAPAADKVTLDSLLKQMTDLSLLAEYPDPPFVAKQFSSYDRRSETPADPEGWFANDDHGFSLYDGVVEKDTPHYKTDPTQKGEPDGKFPAGTKVGIAPNRKPVGDPAAPYVWAYATAPDGRPIDGKIPQGYVQKTAITPDPQGHVLADMDGPGCVVRIWSANPDGAGNIRIYLDGADKPVIEAPMKDLLGGKWKTTIDGKETTPFPDPIACERSRGFNLYFPIAYAKHCKITIDKQDIYYHVDYRTYPKGTEVETFHLESLSKLSQLVKDVVLTLQGSRSITLDKEASGFGKDLKPDERLRIPSDKEQLDGPGVIRRLKVSVRNDDSAAETLRSLVLIGTFDGAARPQIWCPVGDFFASSPGVNPYRSLPFDVTISDDSKSVELEVWWPMPFEKSAKVELLYTGKRPQVWADMHVMVGKYEWTDRSMHFHAKWRTSDMKTRPFRDWTYCDLKGKGVFVGDMLSVMNPVSAWWGEGDEKIYVDGEKFPSWFGTGSEDYYAYAWSDPTPFQHAYHNQTRCDGKGTNGTRGLTSVNRFHVLDCIPFEKSFRFDMEVWHWDPKVTVNYTAVSYWYARPDATDDFEPADPKVLQNLPSVPPPPPPLKVEGALEGEKLKIVGKSSDFPLGPQDLKGFDEGRWSGDAHLWGRPPKTGEWADLEVPVAADGKYKVVVYLTKARDYGIIQFSLDGKPLGKPFDGFEPDKVVATGPVELGTVELKKGTAVLRVEVTGTNDKSVGLRYMWGLDCVVLKPAS